MPESRPTNKDPTAQRDGLAVLGVDPENIYVDHGLTGTNRTRSGLREAMAAVRSGDFLVVTKLDRLARSLPDARDIADELTRKGVSLSLGASVYDPTDPGVEVTHPRAEIVPSSEGLDIGTRDG